jgi:hypothetical protein
MVQKQLYLAVEWKYIISMHVFTARLRVFECKIKTSILQSRRKEYRGNNYTKILINNKKINVLKE